MARRGIPTLDAGTPLMAMHAPFELSSKLDCYMTYRAMKAFFNN
jgi:aspartyl aminopeptidase